MVRVLELEAKVEQLEKDKKEILDNFHAFCHVVKKRMADVEERMGQGPIHSALPVQDEEDNL